jgi:catechol 2,3-dioxygenase-like lactoylglutathione lyase family enzyme
MFYTPAAEQVRAFLKDTLGFPASDVGGGWLIFDGPEVEVGVHPSKGETHHDISFYTDDVEAAVKALSAKGVELSPITDQGYGWVTGFEMPGGVKVAL